METKWLTERGMDKILWYIYYIEYYSMTKNKMILARDDNAKWNKLVSKWQLSYVLSEISQNSCKTNRYTGELIYTCSAQWAMYWRTAY